MRVNQHAVPATICLPDTVTEAFGFKTFGLVGETWDLYHEIGKETIVSEYMPMIPSPPMLGPMASDYHDRIKKQINEFAESLAEDEAVSASVILSNGQVLTATWFGYHNPYMIVVEGVDARGSEVRALIPMQSIEIVLSRAKKSEQAQPLRRIGFQRHEDG